MKKKEFLKHLKFMEKIVNEADDNEDIPMGIFFVSKPDKKDLTPEIIRYAKRLSREIGKKLK
jgi:hypothetical protein